MYPCRLVTRSVLAHDLWTFGAQHNGLREWRVHKLSRALGSSTGSTAYCDLDVAPGTNVLGFYIPSVLSHVHKGMITRKLKLPLVVVNISSHQRWPVSWKLSSCAPGPQTTRMALLMVRCLLFFSGPLGTGQSLESSRLHDLWLWPFLYSLTFISTNFC